LLAGPKLRVTSIAQVIAAARERPGALAIASQGNGTSSHLSAELFKSLAGIDLLHVPYKGTAPAMTDLLGGQVELMFDNLITAMPHVKSGKLRLLGVGGERRIAAFPDVPAIAELLPGFRSETWMALVAPPATPGAITEKLSAAVRRAVHEPDFERLITEMRAERASQDLAADDGHVGRKVHRLRQEIEHAAFVEVDAADDGIEVGALQRGHRLRDGEGANEVEAPLQCTAGVHITERRHCDEQALPYHVGLPPAGCK